MFFRLCRCVPRRHHHAARAPGRPGQWPGRSHRLGQHPGRSRPDLRRSGCRPLRRCERPCSGRRGRGAPRHGRVSSEGRAGDADGWVSELASRRDALHTRGHHGCKRGVCELPAGVGAGWGAVRGNCSATDGGRRDFAVVSDGRGHAGRGRHVLDGFDVECPGVAVRYQGFGSHGACHGPLPQRDVASHPRTWRPWCWPPHRFASPTPSDSSADGSHPLRIWPTGHPAELNCPGQPRVPYHSTFACHGVKRRAASYCPSPS